MQNVHIVRNKEDRRIQTAWFDEESAKRQAKATQDEMEAEEFPAEECHYEVIEVAIQDSVPPSLEFSDGWWLIFGGPAVDKVEKAAKVLAEKANVDIFTALDYIKEIIRDRRS